MGRGGVEVRLGGVVGGRSGGRGRMRTSDVGSGRAMSQADGRLRGEVERQRSRIRR